MKCWRCGKDAGHLASGLHEEVALHDGKSVIVGVIPEVASPPLSQRPMMCDFCWAELVSKLSDELNRRFKYASSQG